jgi:hypothetical protein
MSGATSLTGKSTAAGQVAQFCARAMKDLAVDEA